MPENRFEPHFPEQIEAEICKLAEETGATYDDVVNEFMRVFFKIVDEPESQPTSKCAVVEKVRAALRQKLGRASN